MHYLSPELTMPESAAPAAVISPESFLAHWQAHRRLTRKVIAAFPAESFATFSVGGMRPFSTLASEIVGMATPTAHGVLTGDWEAFADRKAPATQADMLAAWDETTAELDEIMPKIPLSRYQETMTAFGQWTMPAHDLFLYVIDNEIHHRAQGYVYLRALGIQPPQFFDRG
jgi:uncharacterized damage-inducible protein DinB